MGKPYRLLALDMDGTLLNYKQEISDVNKQWIQAASEAGIWVCLATGRGMISALPYGNELGLKTPMVLANGSEVWEAPGKLYSRTVLPPVDVRALRNLALEYDIWYWAYSTEGVMNREKWVEREEDAQWLKFGYYTENTRKLNAVAKAAAEIGEYEITNSHPANIELNPKGISKASGLREVCQLLNLNMEQVVAVGDSFNDLAMIREAGLGVAMANAQDEIKQAADVVTLSNEEDGVSHVIREYLLK